MANAGVDPLTALAESKNLTQIRAFNQATAVLLAGGLGTRLRSVIFDRPKALAEISVRPFLAHLLDQLEGIGIRHVVLCIGYLGDQIQNFFGSHYKLMQLDYSREISLLGTGGALRLALEQTHSDPVLVLNGDSIFDGDLNSFLRWHQEKKADASILLTQMPDSARYGQVTFDEEGRIQNFNEKKSRAAGWVNAGIYLICRKMIASIPLGRPVSLENEMFPSWTGRSFFGYSSDGSFLDIGTPESYEEARHRRISL